MTTALIEATTLQFTDLTGAKTGCIKLGSNKFWKAHVKNDGGSYSFNVLWGPTGKPGKSTGSKTGLSEAAALKLFRTKKRGKIKKGYTELEVRSNDEEVAKQKANGVTATSASAPAVVKSTTRKIQSQVGRLLATIYNGNAAMVRKGLSAQAGSTADNPIGNLSDRQLDIGGAVLDEIASELQGAFGRQSTSNNGKTLPLVGGVPSGRIIQLTNDYLSTVPRELGRGMRGKGNLHKVVISSFDRLQAQREFLQLLRDAHVSKAIFKQAAQARTTSSKEQVWYDGLGCDIEHLNPTSRDYKFAARVFNTKQSRKNSNWFRGNKSRVRLVNVYKFTRQGTVTPFDKYAAKVAGKRGATGNIFAWHGTRTPNLLGIGKSGLLMPENLPRGVHISGKAFGAGIYHAPANNTRTHLGGVRTDGTNGALKSMNYTGHSSAYYGGGINENVFMYLQEVALGTPQVTGTALWNQKRPKGNHDWIYAAASQCNSLTHDEIVTFSEEAQVFRYLCEIAVD